MGASWKAVLGAADEAFDNGGWLRSPESLGHTLEGRYLKELGDGFLAVVHLDPGEGSAISPDGELTLGEGVELVVSATYLPAEFAAAHASPLAFVAAIKTELQDEWVDAKDFIAAPAVLVAAGLQDEARAEIDRARAKTGTSVPDAVWDHLDRLLTSGVQAI